MSSLARLVGEPIAGSVLLAVVLFRILAIILMVVVKVVLSVLGVHHVHVPVLLPKDSVLVVRVSLITI
jgi:hypothetical protein